MNHGEMLLSEFYILFDLEQCSLVMMCNLEKFQLTKKYRYLEG